MKTKPQSAADEGECSQISLSWWISRSSSLSPEHRNAWVVTLIMDQFMKEDEYATHLKRETFRERMVAGGMSSILDEKVAPRKRCKLLHAADARTKYDLADEHAQRLMIKAIGRSIPSYISGIRCWGAFCDAMGVHVHFPASSQMAARYVGMFGSFATITQYLKHLRWAHRFLHLDNCWETPTVKQESVILLPKR